MSYVNNSSMYDTVAFLYDTIDQESDIRLRMSALNDSIRQVSERLQQSIERTCYQAKSDGMPTDLIATELGISQRAVLRMIRSYSVRNNLVSPLDPIGVEGTFDIRDHIRTGRE